MIRVFRNKTLVVKGMVYSRARNCFGDVLVIADGCGDCFDAWEQYRSERKHDPPGQQRSPPKSKCATWSPDPWRATDPFYHCSHAIHFSFTWCSALLSSTSIPQTGSVSFLARNPVSC